MEMRETIALLKSKGYRLTPQRVAILKILKDNTEHPGADEVFRSAMQFHPNISMATVYNVMEVLEREGLIRAIAVTSHSRRFDPNVLPHSHFICNSCQRVFDIPFTDSNGVAPEVPMEFEGFKVESFEIVYRGICSECNRKSK